MKINKIRMLKKFDNFGHDELIKRFFQSPAVLVQVKICMHTIYIITKKMISRIAAAGFYFYGV